MCFSVGVVLYGVPGFLDFGVGFLVVTAPASAVPPRQPRSGSPRAEWSLDLGKPGNQHLREWG